MQAESTHNDEQATAGKRQHILASALDLFANTGYGSTSIRALARHAGISQGLMYTYFSSKDDLLKEIFLLGLQDVRASWQVDGPAGTPSGRIESLLHKSFAIVRQNASFWRLFYAIRTQPEVLERLSLELEGWTEMILTELEGLCRQAGLERPDIEARLLFAFIDGVSQQLVMDPEAYHTEDVIRALLEKYRFAEEEAQ